MPSAIRVAVIAFFAVVVPAASSFAQASGYVRVKFMKAGLMLGAGGGSGVLSYRGRDYPFRVSGLASVGIEDRLDVLQAVSRERRDLRHGCLGKLQAHHCRTSQIVKRQAPHAGASAIPACCAGKRGR
jgi:hypothetical protein